MTESYDERRSAVKPGHTRYEPMPYLMNYLKQHPPKLAFDAETVEEWRTWRRKLIRRFRDCLGIRRIERTPLEVEWVDETDCGDYVRRYYRITTSPGLIAPTFLLVPKDGGKGRRGIVCSHGHGYGANELVGLEEEGGDRTEETYHHNLAVYAVRRGFVVVAHDQLGFGRRRDFTHLKRFEMHPCQQATMVALHLGLSNLAFRIFDAMGMVDFLQMQPEVDPRRIGMVGISGGGVGTQFTTALDTRIKACCVSGFTNTFEASILSLYHCPDNYVPGLGMWAEDPDIACLIAPRAQLVQAGKQDTIFPFEAVEKAVGKIRKVYQLLGVEERLETEYMDTEHVFSNAVVWDFMERHL